MKIAIIGTGYVGLVTGTCLADTGNEVTCIDVDESKIEKLSQGKVPLYEPGLAEMVVRNASTGRLHFTTRLEDAVRAAAVVYLAVGTPVADDGTADLTALRQVIDRIAPCLAQHAVVAIKSTVPVGTQAEVTERLRQKTGRACDVASNPEFLKEGSALHDFLFPDRIVVGVRRPEVADMLRRLYAPFLRTDRPFLVMSPESAEMTKYVASALLSTRISFINEMANLCEQLDADINEVRRGIGHDQRIGCAFLFPGIGYGGSSLPGDMRALAALAGRLGQAADLITAVDAVNARQKLVLFHKLNDHFQGELQGKTVAVWGIAFKPRTDDIRDAPALTLIDRLLAGGARVHVHDPVAMPNVREIYGEQLLYGNHPMDVLVGVNALVIATEWSEFRNPDFAEMRRRMAAPVIVDGRNLFDLVTMSTEGFTYYSIGRRTVRPSAGDGA
ncbi:MAG: UDP-glucose/GDP-mannose dehydrogenase family protein [Pirellulaceae bacterium]|jgi:UDPglucose 6-dehydrogenase|nr:UDP-glucose/GDP-mannose dehydrogenase family protein [Pirellulaceae bacterium]